MKLATLHDGSRDGVLVVVSRDLTMAHFATGVATTLQQVLDDWNFRSPPLQDLYLTLNGGKARHAFAFDPAACLPPLPRACHWAAVAPPQPASPGQADPPPELQAATGDGWLAPCATRPWPAQASTPLVRCGWAAVLGDLPDPASPEQALEAVRLLLLVQQVAAWRRGRPCLLPAAFGPVAVTPEELGPAWHGVDQQAALDWRADTEAPLRPTGAAPSGGPARADRRSAAAGLPAFGPWLSDWAEAVPVRAGAVVAGPHGAWRPWPAGATRCRAEGLAPDGESVFGAIEQRFQPDLSDPGEDVAA